MKLTEIAELFTIVQTIGESTVEITGLEMDSRKIKKGNLFICVPSIDGFLRDRHLFAADAIENGAAALLVQRELPLVIPQIIVKDTRSAMAVIAAHFYGYPSHEMNLIGITGTNGKTTTSYMIEKIFADAGFKTGLMGNNGVKINGQLYPTDINTQEPPSLQRNLRKMRDAKADYCFMEVSSQGLDMGRVTGCQFKNAIFTNLTPDHLDYHTSFEDYRNAKGLLFSRLGNTFHSDKKQYAIINSDDASFSYYRKLPSSEIITYGIKNEADVSASQISADSHGIHFLLTCFKGTIDIRIPLVGRFNVYNALAAIACALVEGISLKQIQKSLAALKSIDGRMDIVDAGQDFLILVDFAHTPDALENVLSSIKEFSEGRIITVFGCGGDRDIIKRPLMGEIAGRMSDYVIITSDNPRTEDPLSIIQDIEKGLQQTGSYETILNREEAINKAIQLASVKDTVLIAGKGHERYQIFKEKTISFDDRAIADKAVRTTKR